MSLRRASDYDDGEQSVALLTGEVAYDHNSDDDIVDQIIKKMEARAEHLKARNYRTLHICTTALGIGLLVMVLVWIVKYRGGFAWTSSPAIQFNWHPLLMITAMIFLYGQAILAYRTGRNSSKASMKLLHASMHLTAFVLAVIGLQAVFDSHNLASIPNLYSFHSWLGLVAVIAFSAQYVAGFGTYLYPKLSLSMRQFFMPVHRAIGIGTFLLALLASLTGLTEKTLWVLDKKYSSLPSEGILINFIALFLAFFGILVLYLVTEVDYKRQNDNDDEQVQLANTE